MNLLLVLAVFALGYAAVIACGSIEQAMEAAAREMEP